MNILRINKTPIFFVIVLCIIITGFLVGCNDITNKKLNESNFSRSATYEKTINEYILMEYFKRYNFDHYKETIESNSALFVVNGEFNKTLATEFIIENLDLFTDSSLYSEIVNEAISKFSYENVEDFSIAFTSDAKKKIFDYKNMNTGINALQFSHAENFVMLKKYAKVDANNLTSYEKVHYAELFRLIEEKETIPGIITFLNSTKNDPLFTDFYSNLLDFAYNTAIFYDEEGTYMFGYISGYGYVAGLWCLGYAIGWDIGGYMYDGNVAGAAYGSITLTSVIGITAALELFEDSFTFDAEN